MKKLHEDTILKIQDEIDDELYLIKNRLQFKFNTSWIQTRNVFNNTIRQMFNIK